MNNPKLKYLFLTLFGILIFVSFALNLKKSKPVKKSVINISTMMIPAELDAKNTISYSNVVLIDNLFPKLFKRDSSLEYKGEIAESWRVNSQEKKISIRMKPMRFSDGTYLGRKQGSMKSSI